MSKQKKKKRKGKKAKDTGEAADDDEAEVHTLLILYFDVPSMIIAAVLVLRWPVLVFQGFLGALLNVHFCMFKPL